MNETREESLIIVNRGGRPRVIQGPAIRLSTWIAVSEYDSLTKRAQKANKSLSQLVREAIQRNLR